MGRVRVLKPVGVSTQFFLKSWNTMKYNTCEPVSINCKGWAVKVFQKRMVLSTVPPPEANKPC